MKTNTLSKLLFAMVLLAVSVAQVSCGGEAGTKIGNPPTIPIAQAYPADLALVSPFATTSSVSGSLSLKTLMATTGSASVFDTLTSQTTQILDGTTLADCVFDPTLFAVSAADAACYGPQISYQNHPDGDDTIEQQLPPGDLGFWSSSDVGSESCAAAELNSRLDNAENKTQASLEIVASLLCTASVNGLDFPADGETLSLTDEMNAMAVANDLSVSFDQADVLRADQGSAKNYIYSIVVNLGALSSDDVLTLSLSHEPANDDGSAYRGKLTYQYATSQTLPSGRCKTESDKSIQAASIRYARATDGKIALHSDSSSYCDGATEIWSESGLLDSTNSNQIDEVNGWADTFEIFSAEFVPSTGAGQFAYTWQSAPGDAHSRNLDATILVTSESDVTGSAFFGFGDSVAENSNPIVNGFICNWTGPGHTQDILPYAQLQEIALNDSNIFVSTADQILYAPTNSCNYDGTGSFTYDSNGDGTADTDPGVVIQNELLSLDANDDGLTDLGDDGVVPAQLSDAGFVKPSDPSDLDLGL